MKKEKSKAKNALALKLERLRMLTADKLATVAGGLLSGSDTDACTNTSCGMTCNNTCNNTK